MKSLNEIKANFTVNSSQTGRFIVKSMRTGKEYFVEAIGDPHLDWGSLDQATGKLSVKKGWKKFQGSIDESESQVTKENGFSEVHELQAGESPLAYIEVLDAKYPDKDVA
jgi:hypothetical protein